MRYYILMAMMLLLGAGSAKASAYDDTSVAGLFPVSNQGREVWNFNPNWRFHLGDVLGAERADYDDTSWGVVSTPHSVKLEPAEASGCRNYQGIAWYRKTFIVPGNRSEIYFEAIMGKQKIYVNGKLAKEHFGGYLPVIVNLKEQGLKKGDKCVVAVMADNSNDKSYPPGKPQYTLDFAYHGGIYRDVWLINKKEISITNVIEADRRDAGIFVHFSDISEKQAKVFVDVDLQNVGGKARKVKVEQSLLDASGKVLKTISQNVLLAAGDAHQTVRQMFSVRNPHLWSPETSYLYSVVTRIKDGKQVLDGGKTKLGINGIYRVSFTPNQFRVIPLPDGDKSGVKAICQLKNGDVLVGARSKNVYLLDMKGRVKQVFDYAHHQIGSIYHAMYDDRQNLWLSTKGDGLVKLTPDVSRPIGYRIDHYRHDARNPYSISGNNVYMTYQDSHHRIWVATLDGGLNLLQEQGGKVRFYNKYHGMKNYPGYGLYMDARNLVEDSHQRMWVGTMDGLMSFRTDFKSVGDLRFETYRNTEINTRANSDIYGLYKDNNRQVWMCTFGGGLSRLDGFDEVTHLPILTSLGAKEGLHNDVIISILEDKMGRLWLVNADGLSCYDYQSDRIQHFDNSDGFPDVQLEESSAALLRNGEIWLGCKEGILAYQPERIHTTRLQYPIYIIGGEVNNRDIRSYNQPAILKKSMVYTDHLTLRHSQSMFTLEFAALNFCNPERISYRYRLKGYDHDWHYAGKNRLASYTNVPSGTYQFIVEVMDATNPDSHSTRELTITILPPWWATWWAYLIYIILISVASYYAFRYAKYQIRLKNNIYIQNQLAEYKRKFNAEQQDKQFADKVRRFMEANLTNTDFEIDMLAQELGMSRSAFFKKTKAVMGCSPSDMVKVFKLSHAVELLKHSDQSITDVAYCCGFTDVGYFGKCFRKKYGMSPREYVAQQQESEIKK